MAFRVAQAEVQSVIATLWAREMPRLVYRPRMVPIEVKGLRVAALTFLADPSHESYAGRLDPEHVAKTIAFCCGARGPNIDYLANTLRHMDALGIRENRLHALLRAVQTKVQRT